ncbi:MAG: (2Fe-2S)-binding protein [Deltaproteobacteria bacterium]|nr:(2Fe-2S)-binding protein [Deltaproteobacteria bacterium]
MVTLKIDGITVQVPEGTTLLQAAQKLGIWIPTLCHHEALTPTGGCRLCVVEIKRDTASQVVSSCVYKVEEGLEVQTATEKIHNIRRCIIELLLAEAPGAKVLRNLARDMGVTPVKRFAPRNELCIACGRCVRACREIVGVSAIDFAKRGYDKLAVSPFYERAEACIGCGTCAEVCPTGAIRLTDIAEGETQLAADGTTVQGPARTIENWKVTLKLKACKECGEAFAPENQLAYFSEKAGLPQDYYDVCRHCRT